MDIKNLLINFEGFSDLDEECIASIAKNTVIETFSKDQIIVQQGAKLDCVWIIIEGAADVSNASSDITKKSLAVLRPNDIFGEISAISGVQATADIVARESLKTLRIPVEALRPVFLKNVATMGKLMGISVRRLRDNTNRILGQG
jgi:CRP-like cAMP-binding protein